MSKQTTLANIGHTGGRRNLLINGGFQVWQRGTSFTGLDNGSDEYTADRWRWDERGNGTAVQTVSQSTDAPPGFIYSYKVECTSTGTSGIYYLQQKIEGQNCYVTGWNQTTGKKQITVSFWIKCTKTGKFSGAITTSDESYGYAFDVTVVSANAWKKYEVTIPAPPTEPSLGVTGVGLILQFALANDNAAYRGPKNTWHDNSNPLHATDDVSISIDQANDILYITGIQLEIGAVASEFEPRGYGEELALCQRYYQRLTQGRLGGVINGSGQGIVTNQMVNYPYMRTSPSSSVVGSPGFYYMNGTTQVNQTVTTTSFSGYNLNMVHSGGNTGDGLSFWSDLGSTKYIEFDAEI